MTTPPSISCLHWSGDGELALEDYLDLPMSIIDAGSDLGRTAPIGELATCKNLPRANTRRSLDKSMGVSCESSQKGKKLARN